MWSFEGVYRKRPNISLSGASHALDKNAFLEKIRKERHARQVNKQQENAAVCIQAFLRGALCRKRIKKVMRDAYDRSIQSPPSPCQEDWARSTCLKLLLLHESDSDNQRVMSLCLFLVKNNALVKQWLLEYPVIWQHILSQLIRFSMEAVNVIGDGSNTSQHAGPLRLLEVLLLPDNSTIMEPQQQADCVFGLLVSVIKKGYFQLLLRFLVMKVPPFENFSTLSMSPLATSLLNLIMYPLHLVSSCRRNSEDNSAECAVKHWRPYDTNSCQASLCSRLPDQQLAAAKASEILSLVKSPASPVSGDNSCLAPPLSLGSLVCYGFQDTAVTVPATFINICLYNFIMELLATAGSSQVHYFLLPVLQANRMFMSNTPIIHALLQAFQLVLGSRDDKPDPDTKLSSRAGVRGGRNSRPAATTASNVTASAQLVALLTLIPVKTRLAATSLQLYLQTAKRLVRQTVEVMPKQNLSTYSESAGQVEEHVNDEDLTSESSSSETDEDECDEAMDVICSSTQMSNKCSTTEANNYIELGTWCLQHLNSPSYVSWLLDEVESTSLDREVLIEFCGLTHSLLTAPCLSLLECRLMYGVVERQNMQRVMWNLLINLYPNWSTSSAANEKDRRGRGVNNSRLIDSLSRGVHLDAVDRDMLVPVLASFATTLLAVLATLHDSELVVSPQDNLRSIVDHNLSVLYEHDAEEKVNNSSSRKLAFTVAELVIISRTLRDVCIGLAELAHPDVRASSLTDASYKPVWDHCFKCCVSVVRQLQLRDSRRPFCPPKHWLTARISLPDIPQMSSYRRLLNANTRRRTFMPVRWRTRSQLMAEQGDSKSGPISLFEKVRAMVLQELPFVFPFTSRAEIFMALVRDDHSVAQQDSGFNLGPTINLKVRRSHIYEDSFEKLSRQNEPNLRLLVRVRLRNEAGLDEVGIDGGGLFREFLSELLKTAFDPNRGFFLLTHDNTLYPNPLAHALHPDFQEHYYFIGRMLGKALYEKLLVEIPLAPFFLAKLLSRKGFSIEFHHLDSLDPELCRNLLYLKTYSGDVQELGLDFTVLVSELGHNRVEELVPGGTNIPVTNENKIEYIYRMADYKLNRQIARQTYAFRKGLHDVVPAQWLQLFDWRELQTMISGSSTPVNIEDLKSNTVYGGVYSNTHHTVVLFWQVVEQFSEPQRRQLLKFVTSCSRPPLLGFKDLHPSFCIQPSGSEERLPSSSTCMNLLKLPEYNDPITLKEKLLYAITSNAGFELS